MNQETKTLLVALFFYWVCTKGKKGPLWPANPNQSPKEE